MGPEGSNRERHLLPEKPLPRSGAGLRTKHARENPMKTRLSVILFVYNGMPYLPDAVESILRKSFADFTFMIVNDAKSVKGY
jgi:hypothetical protein